MDFLQSQSSSTSLFICFDLFHIVQSGINIIPGVHTPFVNFGSSNSEFPAHLEDGDVCGIPKVFLPISKFAIFRARELFMQSTLRLNYIDF